eukprot:11964083-Ditylum_brightwellii.AAC.1
MPAAWFLRLVSTVLTLDVSACMFAHWWTTVALDFDVTALCTIIWLVECGLLREFLVLVSQRWS